MSDDQLDEFYEYMKSFFYEFNKSLDQLRKDNSEILKSIKKLTSQLKEYRQELIQIHG